MITASIIGDANGFKHKGVKHNYEYRHVDGSPFNDSHWAMQGWQVYMAQQPWTESLANIENILE